MMEYLYRIYLGNSLTNQKRIAYRATLFTPHLPASPKCRHFTKTKNIYFNYPALNFFL